MPKQPKTKTKAKELAKSASGSNQFSQKRKEKTSYFGNKTSKQAKAQLVKIYGKKSASSAGDLNKIAAKQKGYSAAFKTQEAAVKKKRVEAQAAIEAALQNQSRLVGRSWLSKTFTSTNAEKTRKNLKKEIKKEEEVLTKLQTKKSKYNAEAAKKVQSIIGSKASSGNAELKQKLSPTTSLVNTLSAVRTSYDAKRKAQVEPTIAAFQVAADKKKAMNNVVLNKKLAVRSAQSELEKAQLMISATSKDKTAKNQAIANAKLTIETAKKAYTEAAQHLTDPKSGYAIAKKQVETLGKQLVKKDKFSMIAAADLNKVARKVTTYTNATTGTSQDFKAKQQGELKAFTSSIQSESKTAKYGAYNKLKAYASPSSQTKLLDLITMSKDSTDPAVLKKAVKAQAVLDILSKNQLLVGDAKTLYTKTDQHKVSITPTPTISAEIKEEAKTKLNNKIATNVQSKAEPSFISKAGKAIGTAAQTITSKFRKAPKAEETTGSTTTATPDKGAVPPSRPASVAPKQKSLKQIAEKERQARMAAAAAGL